jgi:hypothetical protein
LAKKQRSAFKQVFNASKLVGAFIEIDYAWANPIDYVEAGPLVPDQEPPSHKPTVVQWGGLVAHATASELTIAMYPDDGVRLLRIDAGSCMDATEGQPYPDLSDMVSAERRYIITSIAGGKWDE